MISKGEKLTSFDFLFYLDICQAHPDETWARPEDSRMGSGLNWDESGMRVGGIFHIFFKELIINQLKLDESQIDCAQN